MTEINIDTDRLKAMRILAATGDIRYYLNGVCVEATASETRLLATDGSVAGFLRRCNPVDNVNVEYEEFIIPNAVIDALPKNKGTQPIATVLIDKYKGDTEEASGAGYTLRLWNGTLIPFQPEAGVFPDLRRVLPMSEGNGAGAQIDAELYMRFAKVNKALGSKEAGRVTLCHNGPENAMRVRLGSDDFVGVLMPWRATGGAILKTGAIDALPPRRANKIAKETAE